MRLDLLLSPYHRGENQDKERLVTYLRFQSSYVRSQKSHQDGQTLKSVTLITIVHRLASIQHTEVHVFISLPFPYIHLSIRL